MFCQTPPAESLVHSSYTAMLTSTYSVHKADSSRDPTILGCYFS
jgi:hypothetical protein